MANSTSLPSIARGKNKFGSPHKNIHELSVFESTGWQRGYFIIHPQWTSEAQGAKRLSVRERGYHSWDCRPSHPAPLDRYTKAPTPKPATPSREDLLGETMTRQKSYIAQLSAREASASRQEDIPPAPMSARAPHSLVPLTEKPGQLKKFTYY